MKTAQLLFDSVVLAAATILALSLVGCAGHSMHQLADSMRSQQTVILVPEFDTTEAVTTDD